MASDSPYKLDSGLATAGSNGLTTYPSFPLTTTPQTQAEQIQMYRQAAGDLQNVLTSGNFKDAATRQSTWNTPKE